MPVLLDTNVYLFAIRSAEGATFFEHRFIPLVFQTFISGIVVEELYAGALTRGAIQLVDRYVGTLERAGRIVAPTFQDWKEAGTLIAGMTAQEAGRKRKVQQMLNDVLLALTARRIGADLFTFNGDDFELIRRHKPFSLKVLRAQ